MKTIYSWNVNGIRAAEKKGLFNWLKTADPDILCLQETKALKEQLSGDFFPEDYHAFFKSAERKGYSGTAVYTKEQPLEVESLNVKEFDAEGRVTLLHFDAFSLYNCYFPNSQAEGARLDYKIAFCEALLDKANELSSSGRNVLICGDYNIAHKPIDLANPKRNEQNPGYLPEERDWMEKFVQNGWVDTFRVRHPEPEQYTWWSYRFKAREKNVGWRIDYHCVNNGFDSKVVESVIHGDIMGSDHCPIRIDLDI